MSLAKELNGGTVVRRCQPLAPRLIEWYRSEGRHYPWRSDTNPYAVLVALFMLQRTGVSQVMQVYGDFMHRYPTLESLRAAQEGELAAALHPLGRLGRTRSLRALVEALTANYEGRIPDDLEELDSLPGLGQYSARALLVLAFGRPYIMLDPNSYRVLHRACGITAAKTRPHADREMILALDTLVPEEDAAAYNLALLDVGSTICRRRIPRHELCPLADACEFLKKVE